jgi:hypothetical protein
MGKQAREVFQAVAYLRTSSAANVGADKDSERRQREAIQSFAKRAGYEIVDEFYDAAVSGADAIIDSEWKCSNGRTSAKNIIISI